MTPRRRFNECPRCGELNRRSSPRCGVCGHKFPAARVVPEAELDGAPLDVVLPLIGLFLLIWLGVGLQAPGLGILLAILMIGPLVRTLRVVSRRAQRGERPSLTEAIALFLSSTMVAFVVISVVLMAALGTFCFMCYAVFVSVS